MKIFPLFLAVTGWLGALRTQSDPEKEEHYLRGPDSMVKDGVPRGTGTRPTRKSKLFPGTVRVFFVHVPAQYDPNGSEEAAVMVSQDGPAYRNPTGQIRATTVFDNQIHALALEGNGIIPRDGNVSRRFDEGVGQGIG